MKLGIDFGTTFSLPAMHDEISDHDIILLKGGIYGIPSVVYYDSERGVLVGHAAESAGQGSKAVNLKRDIKMSLNASVLIGGRTFTGVELAGYILSAVKAAAVKMAEEELLDEPIEGAVISVPAAFGHNERKMILEAARMPESKGGPGLNVIGLIKEPVAAAISYFQASLKDKTRILVYDLGGGTCDVAIVEADSTQSEKYRVIAAGMKRIGGRDWDNRLVEYMQREIGKKAGVSAVNSPGNTARIRREAVVAKHALSDNPTFTATVDIGDQYAIDFTRELFDELTGDLFRETLELTRSIIERNKDKDISEFICVGGSSNMPQVQEGLKKAFPSMNFRVYRPEKAIALGAAVYAQYCDTSITADSLGDNKGPVSDISPHSFGIRAYWNYDEDPEYEVIFNLIFKDDRLPKSASHIFRTTTHGQKRVSFKVYESERTESEYDFVYDCREPIMDVILDLKEVYPKGTPMNVDMTLNSSGLLCVVAQDDNGHIITVEQQLHF